MEPRTTSSRLGIATIADTKLVDKTAGYTFTRRKFTRHHYMMPDRWHITLKNSIQYSVVDDEGGHRDLALSACHDESWSRMTKKLMGKAVDSLVTSALMAESTSIDGAYDMLAGADVHQVWSTLLAEEERLMRWRDASEVVGDTSGHRPAEALSERQACLVLAESDQAIRQILSIGRPSPDFPAHYEISIPSDMSATCLGGVADAVVLSHRTSIPVIVDIKTTKFAIGQSPDDLGSQPKCQSQLIGYLLATLLVDDEGACGVAAVNPRLGCIEWLTVDDIAEHIDVVRSLGSDLLGLDHDMLALLEYRLAAARRRWSRCQAEHPF